jgi:alkylated DNA repair dioxygenase AlkB
MPDRFNGKKGQFHLLAPAKLEQQLVDRIHGALGNLSRAVLVAPVLTHEGERLQHHSRPPAYLGRAWVWVDQWQDDAEADPDVGDVLLDGVVLPPPPPGAAGNLPLYEYKVCVQFNDPYSNRPRDWALRLLNTDPLHPLVAAATPLTASTEEDAVEMMLSGQCCEKGAFSLDPSTLTMLLHHRYSSLSDELEVVETIAKHVPLKKVADAQHRRDILCRWKRRFPGELGRLQPRRCDPALSTLVPARAPYKKGWHQWMDSRITPQPPEEYTSNPLVNEQPLVLLGPPTLDTTAWARSHGPHVYMHGRLDLPLLHDCLGDGDARYIVLDNIPWPQLLGEEKHGHSILTNAAFSWYHGRQLKITMQYLPVIVLNSHLPNPNDARWAPRGWQHWKPILQVVKLLPHVPLMDEGAAAQSKQAAHDVDEAVTADGCSPRRDKFLAELAAAAATPMEACGSDINSNIPMTAVPTTSPPPTRPRTRLQSRSDSLPPQADVADFEKAHTAGAPPIPLKLDFARRLPYGPDSFLYPDAIPVAHRQRLLHVAAGIEYVQMMYRGRDLARQKDFQSDNLGESYAFYEYTGSVPDVWHKGEWSPELLELRDALREATGEPINSMVANQYLDREATIGHHSDKTPDIQRGASISTVSLGATRLFELHSLDGRETLSVPLTDGSVFQIGPLTNAAYTHSIPPMVEDVGPRYGLTFRTLASRWLHNEQVALRQPARDGEPWLVEKKATRLDANGKVVLRQDGYPSRRVVHLAPFELDDPCRVQESDIIRLRQRLLSTTPPNKDACATTKQKRTSVSALVNKSKRQRKALI